MASLEPPDGARHAMADAVDQHTHDVEQVLQPIAEADRTESVSGQFWIWCGANIAPINWVLGALGINLGLGPARHPDRPRRRQPDRHGGLRAVRPHGAADRGHRHGAVAGRLRPARRLRAGGDPGAAGRRLVRGQHLDHPRPGHGPAGAAGGRRPGGGEPRREDRRRAAHHGRAGHHLVARLPGHRRIREVDGAARRSSCSSRCRSWRGSSSTSTGATPGHPAPSSPAASGGAP